MYRIRKKFRFEAAHVLTSSISEACQNIHGHSYVVEMIFQSARLNDDGMIIDFGCIKTAVGSLIEKWDHALILHKPIANLEGLGYDIVVVGFNPTAENMAWFIYNLVHRYTPLVCKVRVHETETGYAEYEYEEDIV